MTLLAFSFLELPCNSSFVYFLVQSWVLMCCTYISNLVWIHAQLLSHVGLCDAMEGSAWQAPLFMVFSRQEYWSGFLFPSPGDLSDQGIESASPISQVDFFFFYHWAIEIIFNQVVERLYLSILNKNNLNAECSIDYYKVKCQHEIDINDFLHVEGQFSYHSSSSISLF